MMKNVPVEELYMYRGQVVEDVMSATGTLLLPRGGDLKTLLDSNPSILPSLVQWGIKTVLISIPFDLPEEVFERIVDSIHPRMRALEARIARGAIMQVEKVYRTISDNGSLGDGAYELAKQASLLAEEVAKAPQIVHCLGRVRDIDEYTYVHSLNVGLLSGYLANKLKPGDREFVTTITYGGLLHDIGKALVSQDVLNKPGRLTVNEYEEMKRHSVLGHEIALNSGITDSRILVAVRNHHERWNGEGYPDGLEGASIPLYARIMAVADVFDALTSKRVYKGPSSSRDAVSMILESSDESFDRSIVRLLLLSVGLYPPGTVVELSDSSVGVVVGAKDSDLLRPLVYINVDDRGRRAPDGVLLDLSQNKHLYVRRVHDDAGKGILYT